jgi:hypothetical protein
VKEECQIGTRFRKPRSAVTCLARGYPPMLFLAGAMIVARIRV